MDEPCAAIPNFTLQQGWRGHNGACLLWLFYFSYAAAFRQAKCRAKGCLISTHRQHSSGAKGSFACNCEWDLVELCQWFVPLKNRGASEPHRVHCHEPNAVHGNTGATMHYTYVLISLKDRKLYIGYTQDLERRLQEHKLGKVPSTKSRLPLKPLYFEGHFVKDDAIRREDYFKTSKGKSTLQQMLRTSLQNPEKLPDKWSLTQSD